MALMMCFVCNEVYAYNIAVENAYGVTIYYNYSNEGKELAVTSGGYSGSVVIPEEVTYDGITRKVTSIGSYAFDGCSGLTSVTIPGIVTSIGYSAFAYCSGLTRIIVQEGNPIYDSRDNCNAIIETSTNTLIAGCQNTIIPNSVTSIGDFAFDSCSGLTSVTIPGSVTSIGMFAFLGCSGLTSVTIPNSVTSIGEGAFYGCSGLTSVTIPSSVTSIKGRAFYGCSGLTGIIVQEGNPIYDSRDNCNAIIETSTNTLIAGCQNTIFPNSVTSIGEWAFYECSGLTSVTIPSSVTSIGYEAFSGCSGLTSVTIPGSVTWIGDRAFYGCDLESVVSLIEEPFAITGKARFSQNTFDNATLYVPVGTIDKYKATEGWKDFAHIVEGVPAVVEEVRAENGQTERYRLDGRRVAKMQRGINIVRDKAGVARKVLVR